MGVHHVRGSRRRQTHDRAHRDARQNRGRRAADAHRAGIVQGAARVRRPARAVLPHRRRDGMGCGRKPVHHRRQQHVEQRRIADRRAARPGAVGRSARRREHNDLRGKILRIHPEPDGTYTIPAGNLFPPGTPGTRPEIYTMGHRNPWRVSVDSRTGYVYWGEVGPDNGTTIRTSDRAATRSSTRRGSPASSAGRSSSRTTSRFRSAITSTTSCSRRRIQSADEHVRQQHGPEGSPAGDARDDLLPERGVRPVPRCGNRRTLRGGRSDLSPHGFRSVGTAALARVLRRQVARHRLFARLGHLRHAGQDSNTSRWSGSSRRSGSPSRWT